MKRSKTPTAATGHGWDTVKRQPKSDERIAIDVLRQTMGGGTRWALRLLLAFSLVASLSSLMTWTQVQSINRTPPTSASILQQPGRDRAWAYAEQWLTQANGIMPDARIIAWEGTTPTQVSDGGKTTLPAQTHHLTVENHGRWWRLDLTCDQNGSPLDDPSLTPIPVNANVNDSTVAKDWPDTVGELKPSDALKAILTKWGQAFAGSDAQLLRSLVEDPDPKATYVPLNLGDATVQVGTAAYLDRGQVDRSNAQSDMGVVRVTIQFQGSGGSVGASLAFDVLVQDPDAGSPRILAWGAPGAGPELQPQQNRGSADDAETVARNAQDASKATPTPTATSPSTGAAASTAP